jgi:hypothetical protein
LTRDGATPLVELGVLDVLVAASFRVRLVRAVGRLDERVSQAVHSTSLAGSTKLGQRSAPSSVQRFDQHGPAESSSHDPSTRTGP